MKSQSAWVAAVVPRFRTIGWKLAAASAILVRTLIIARMFRRVA